MENLKRPDHTSPNLRPEIVLETIITKSKIYEEKIPRTRDTETLLTGNGDEELSTKSTTMLLLRLFLRTL